jgi:cytosine/adenosine deaminase-related metal-dependent hydrolase
VTRKIKNQRASGRVMDAFSLRARAVFPVAGEPILDSVVNVYEGRISSVGHFDSRAATAGDLGDVALLPGLVNAHTHLEFSELRAPLGKAGISLPEWINLLLAGRNRRGRSAKPAIIAGLGESLRHGVTTVGEISRAPSSDYESESARPQVRQFIEVIGFSNVRAVSVADALVNQLDEIKRTETLQPGISPHAPYSVSPRLLERAIDIACTRQLPVAMHLAESTAELQLLSQGSGPFRELLEARSMWDAEAIPPGSRPMNYLQALAKSPRALVVHGNYLAADEFDFLAEHRERMTLIHCPRTHAYFGHPPLDIAKLLRQGVAIALGTDSRASNPDLCLLSEMRFLSAAHPDLSPRATLELGTLAGAKALGLADSMGALATGYLANMVAVPIPSDAGSSPDEILSAILADYAQPSGVWLRGEKVEGA